MESGVGGPVEDTLNGARAAAGVPRGTGGRPRGGPLLLTPLNDTPAEDASESVVGTMYEGLESDTQTYMTMLSVTNNTNSTMPLRFRSIRSL